jgi:hypothetical protein
LVEVKPEKFQLQPMAVHKDSQERKAEAGLIFENKENQSIGTN